MTSRSVLPILSAALIGGAIAMASGEAHAGGKWGLHSGDTLTAGSIMPYAEVGYPDEGIGVHYGLTDRIEIGGRIGFHYAPIYHPSFLAAGMSAAFTLRISLAKTEKVSALIHLDPGLKVLTFSGPFLGIQFPVGAEIGIHLTREATLQIGLDVPVAVNLTNGVFANIVPMAGPGFEYQISDKMAVGANTRFGATIIAGGDRGVTFSGVGFGFLTHAYFGYKI